MSPEEEAQWEHAIKAGTLFKSYQTTLIGLISESVTDEWQTSTELADKVRLNIDATNDQVRKALWVLLYEGQVERQPVPGGVRYQYRRPS